MTDEAQPQTTRKRTPKDASEFEREQLRFFLAGGDLAATLASVNPSLAWLPILFQMKLIERERQVISWIERNLGNPDAIREVVDNIALLATRGLRASFRTTLGRPNLSALPRGHSWKCSAEGTSNPTTWKPLQIG